MSLTINGKTPESITIEGKAVESLSISGEIVWSVAPSGPDYLYFKNTSNTSGNFYIVKFKNPSWTPVMEYSLDKTTWTSYDFSTRPSVSVPANSKIYFRGINTSGFCRAWDYGWGLHMDVVHIVGGNILSLQDYVNMDTVNSVPYHGLSNVFYNDTLLEDAYDMNVGSLTSLTSQGCFAWMFQGCSGLRRSPDFSCITSMTGWRCANNIFYLCSSLSTIYAFNVQNWEGSDGQQYTLDWVDGVAATGTMYCPAGVSIETGNSGIPSGWTRVDY